MAILNSSLNAQGSVGVGLLFQTNYKKPSFLASKNRKISFDFEGVYSEVKPLQHIAYGLADGRSVQVDFIAEGNKTLVVETFDAETENPLDMQRAGWQAILDNFKKHVEQE